MTKVHYCDWASQPDLHLCCGDDPFTTPAWGDKQDRSVPDVFTANDGRRYTFEREKVTCPDCIERPKKFPETEVES